MKNTYTYSHLETVTHKGFKPNPEWRWWKFWVNEFIWVESQRQQFFVRGFEAENDAEAEKAVEGFIKVYGKHPYQQLEFNSPATPYIPTSEASRTNLIPNSQ